MIQGGRRPQRTLDRAGLNAHHRAGDVVRRERAMSQPDAEGARVQVVIGADESRATNVVLLGYHQLTGSAEDARKTQMEHLGGFIVGGGAESRKNFPLRGSRRSIKSRETASAAALPPYGLASWARAHKPPIEQSAASAARGINAAHKPNHATSRFIASPPPRFLRMARADAARRCLGTPAAIASVADRRPRFRRRRTSSP